MSAEVRGSHILDQVGTLGTCSGKNTKVLSNQEGAGEEKEVQQLAFFWRKARKRTKQAFKRKIIMFLFPFVKS